MRHRTVVALGLTVLMLVVPLGAGRAPVAAIDEAANPTVTVDAKHPWIDSGLIVREGERLSFQATGTIQWGSKADQVAGPEGHGAKPGKLGKAGLIGRVGFSGKPFAIGNARTPISMPKSGKLFLGINDFIFADNVGAFTVTISRSATQ